MGIECASRGELLQALESGVPPEVCFRYISLFVCLTCCFLDHCI